MSVLYCSTIDVNLFSRITYDQLGFTNLGEYGDWIQGTLIPKCMSMVDSYCRHNFLDNTGTITLDGSGKETQHITPSAIVTKWPDAYPEFPCHLMPVPLMRVTSVSIDDVAQTLSNFQTYSSYVTYEDNVFCKGRQNVEIIARYGYGTVPHDIQYVTAHLCANTLRSMLKRYIAPDIITKAIMQRGALTTYYAEDAALTPPLKDILDKYKYHAGEVA